MNNKEELLLIQPNTSLTGAFVRMLPLGLLYASSQIIKKGYSAKLIDLRINPSNWMKDLEKAITDKTLIVGISAMTGIAISEGIKVSRFIKERYPDINVVWGGPHVTFSPESVFEEKTVDFAIRGYGSVPFTKLYEFLLGKSSEKIEEIVGLSYRGQSGRIFHNKIDNHFEFVDYNDIPYWLIENFSNYRHVVGNETVFPIYSVMGCPYKCAFCSSPAQYATFGKKWVPYETKKVVSHIKMVKEKYGATYIYFIDDDSFVDLNHVEEIIDAIKKESLDIKLGFRGARINEISKMSDNFLQKLVDAGTNTMHIGVESGSDRLLTLMKKNTTCEQIIEANRKLAKHKQIRVFYNFIVGFPTETIEETLLTRDIVLKLMEDNPNACIIPLNKPRPLPNTELYRLAIKHGYVPPKNLEEWSDYEVESSYYNPPWLSKGHNDLIRMLFLTMYFIDGKIHRLAKGNSIKFMVLKFLAIIYKPLALYRFRKGYYKFLIEDYIYNFLKKLI